jgi:hypothetical protein
VIIDTCRCKKSLKIPKRQLEIELPHDNDHGGPMWDGVLDLDTR